jgi:hypothetical protein
MNIDNLLDPMGGQSSSTMNSGLLSIAGWGMDHNLAEKFLLKPLLKSIGKGVRRERNKFVRKQMTDYRNIQGPLQPAEQVRSRFRSDFNKAKFVNLKDTANRFKTYSKNIRKIGWAFIAAGVYGLAESAFTPGISKVAAKKEQELFMNENPLDSGAAYTQRQRALQAIFDSQTSLPNIIGNESSYMHR